MTFLACGTALATACVGAEAVAAGTLAATGLTALGTAGAAGAAGAGLGAIGAAATGGDVGKGALMGGIGGAVTGGLSAGLGGLAGAGASTGANVAIGAASGAAGGAAGSAAAGEDAGKGALMGGVMGGIGGYMKGAGPVGEANSKVADAAGEVNKLPSTANEQALKSATNSATIAKNAYTPSGSFSSDMSNIGKYAVDQPMAVAKAGAPMLVQGAMNGRRTTPTMAELQSSPSIGGAPLSPNFVAPPYVQPTTVPQYYADGGDINSQTPQTAQPMNKFAQIGMQIAQQNQQAAQAQQVNQAGITAQQPMQTYAEGGNVLNKPKQNGMFETNNQAHDEFLDQIAQNTQRQIQSTQPVQPVQPVQQNQGIASTAPVPPVAPVAPVQPRQNITPVTPVTPVAPIQAAANGGLMQGDNLGGYSHGGIAGLTRGPGDGVSDDIPAQIGISGKQPARLADGEFVISSRIVSELGNGSTEAGAKRLQAMVDRVQSRRKKSIGKGKVAVDSKSAKELIA